MSLKDFALYDEHGNKKDVIPENTGWIEMKTMKTSKLLNDLELSARLLHEQKPILAKLLLHAAQVIDAARLMRLGLTLDESGNYPEIDRNTSYLPVGIKCWDKLTGDPAK